MPSALASVSASIANNGSSSTAASTTRSAGTPAEAAAPGCPLVGSERGNPWLVASNLREIENDSSLVVRGPLGEGQRSQPSCESFHEPGNAYRCDFEPVVQADLLGWCQPHAISTPGCPRVPLSFSMPPVARWTLPSKLPKSDA